VGIFDPISQPDPDRDERLKANGTHVEIRPSARVAHLATRALACPSCGVPVAIDAPLGWNQELICDFCDHVALTRDYVQRRGWPEVSVVARLR
jgi:hypothetical protein